MESPNQVNNTVENQQDDKKSHQSLTREKHYMGWEQSTTLLQE